MADENVLTRKKKFGYGLGHILNDLCASMWFTYLLVSFRRQLFGHEFAPRGELLPLG
jgi:Na+/melibiose symporter-like transporter